MQPYIYTERAFKPTQFWEAAKAGLFSKNMVPRPKKAVTEGDMEARLIAVDDFLYSLKHREDPTCIKEEEGKEKKKKEKERT